MDSLRALYSIISGTAGSVGAMLVLFDGGWDKPPTMRQAFGCTLVILSVSAAMMLPLIGHRSDVNEAFKVGHDAGYRKGRRTHRPAVVPLRKPKKGA